MDVPRILMLVLANDDGGLYSALQTYWKRYMNSSPHIDCYFIKGRLEQEEEFILDENTLFIKTREGYDQNDALYVKTLSAFRYFRPSLVNYDFVFRTNLSSHIRFDKYLDFCKTLPRKNLCAAPIGTRDTIPFPSGAGFTLSIDLVNRLIEDPPKHYIMDDVTIGIAMHNWGIKIHPAEKYDIVSGCTIDNFKSILEDADDSVFHYRIRTYDAGRYERDTIIHGILFDRFYPTQPPKTTIVTMFFDLSKLSDSTAGVRDQAFYMKNARGTLQIPAPMVIFCDATTRPSIEELRRELTDAPTIYIEKNIVEYDFYNINIRQIQENRKGLAEYTNSRNTPSYFIATMFKIIGLKIAKDRADFSTSHYAWVDFGCRHVIKGAMLKPAIQMCLNPNPKVSVTYIHYRDHMSLSDMVGFVNKGPCGIAAGTFSVEGAYMDSFYSATMSIFHEMLYKKCGHTEETVLTYCYDRHPELFTLIYGDYYSLLANYKTPTTDFHAIRYHFIENALKAGRSDLAAAAVKKVLESVNARQIILADHELAYLNGIFSMNITKYLNSKGYGSFEGNCDEEPVQKNDLRGFVTENVKVMQEIGFNAGHSADAFLSTHPDVHLVSFDIGLHPYVHIAKEYIDIKYPGRHTLILGDSTKTIPKYRAENPNKTFDLIFIDGGHSYEVAKADLDNCIQLSHANTVIIMDDTNHTDVGITVHNIGPTRAWTERIEDRSIVDIGRKMYTYARGMSWGKIVVPNKIDGTFVINLERRPDRLRDFDAQMKMFGLSYERFNAIDIEGGVGCHYSHLECLKLAKSRGYKNVLIFEDDFDFVVTPDEFKASMADIPASYDVIMLAYSLEASEPFSGRFVKVLKASAPAGYIVHEKMFDTLINIFEDAGPKLKETGKHWLYANDSCWHSIQAAHEWYAFHPRLGKQRASYSDNAGKDIDRGI